MGGVCLQQTRKGDNMSEARSDSFLRTLFQVPLRGREARNRFLVGSLVFLASFFVPILPLVLISGYRLRLMRQAIAGDDLCLPEWDDWGQLLRDGLCGMLISVIYLLPGILVFFGGMGLYIAFSFVLPFAMASLEDSPAMMAVPFLFLIAMGILFLSMTVGTVLSIVGGVPLPVAKARFVAQDKLAAAFEIRAVWALLRANALGYLIAWVVTIGLFGLIYLGFWIVYASIVLCCLVPILMAPLSFYLSLLSAGLFGHTYRESLSRSAMA
jgi:hypothetical protein